MKHRVLWIIAWNFVLLTIVSCSLICIDDNSEDIIANADFEIKEFDCEGCRAVYDTEPKDSGYTYTIVNFCNYDAVNDRIINISTNHKATLEEIISKSGLLSSSCFKNQRNKMQVIFTRKSGALHSFDIKLREVIYDHAKKLEINRKV